MTLTVKSEVARLVKENGLRTSAALSPALDLAVKEVIEKACRRAKASGRTTLLPQDI